MLSKQFENTHEKFHQKVVERLLLIYDRNKRLIKESEKHLEPSFK